MNQHEEIMGVIRDNVPHLENLLQIDGVYLAGGLLRTICSEDEELIPLHTDVDLFFQSGKSLALAVNYIEKSGDFTSLFECGALVCYRHNSSGWRFQLIAMNLYPTLQDVINSFDFTCTCWGLSKDEFIHHTFAYEDTLAKRLRWNKLTHPASSLRRMMKYAKKGYHMIEEDYVKFVRLVSTHSEDIVDEEMVYVD